MTITKILTAMVVVMTLFVQAQTANTVVQPIQPRKVALIVQNHAAPEAGIPMMALTDSLTAKLSGRGFQVINPYNAVGVNQNKTVIGEKTPETSALNLARQLGTAVVSSATICGETVKWC